MRPVLDVDEKKLNTDTARVVLHSLLKSSCDPIFETDLRHLERSFMGSALSGLTILPGLIASLNSSLADSRSTNLP